MTRYVGIDIAKDRLDVAIREVERPEGTDEPDSALANTLCLDNSPDGRDELVGRLKELDPARIVLEASGGLERAVVAALGAAALPVVVANPLQTNEFAKALGQLEKTDQIDAEVLALFAERIRPEARPLPSKTQRRLEALVDRRRQLVEMRQKEANRLHRAEEAVQPSLTEHIEYLDKRLEEVERELEKLIEESPAWKAQEDLLCSVPGVAETTARTLLATVPELGEANRQEIAKLVGGPLVGLAPLACESGKWKGERHIRGGRAEARSALYMATLACLRHNDRIRSFYQRLVDRGKEAKVALLAAARKLLVILNTMLKNQTPWQPDHSPAAA